MKRYLVPTVILIILLNLALPGCKVDTSDTVDQDQIYAVYELLYDQNTNLTYARASFYFGSMSGTLLELVSPSQVRFENDILKKTSPGYYEMQFEGKKDSGSFIWKDYNGKEFINQVKLPSEIDFPAGLSYISRSNSFEFIWQGDSIASGEKITLLVKSSYNSKEYLFSTDTLHIKSIWLGREGLQILPYGMAELLLERNQSFPLLQKTYAGGSLTGKYRTENITVNLQ